MKLGSLILLLIFLGCEKKSTDLWDSLDPAIQAAINARAAAECVANNLDSTNAFKSISSNFSNYLVKGQGFTYIQTVKTGTSTNTYTTDLTVLIVDATEVYFQLKTTSALNPSSPDVYILKYTAVENGQVIDGLMSDGCSAILTLNGATASPWSISLTDDLTTQDTTSKDFKYTDTRTVSWNLPAIFSEMNASGTLTVIDSSVTPSTTTTTTSTFTSATFTAGAVGSTDPHPMPSAIDWAALRHCEYTDTTHMPFSFLPAGAIVGTAFDYRSCAVNAFGAIYTP